MGITCMEDLYLVKKIITGERATIVALRSPQFKEASVAVSCSFTSIHVLTVQT